MQVIKLGNKDVAIEELNFDDASQVDEKLLVSVNDILDSYQDWDKSSFELAILKPKLFIKLLSASTGEKKKYLKSLPAKHFDVLVFIFLSVNAEFFIQRLKMIKMAK